LKELHWKQLLQFHMMWLTISREDTSHFISFMFVGPSDFVLNFIIFFVVQTSLKLMQKSDSSFVLFIYFEYIYIINYSLDFISWVMWFMHIALVYMLSVWLHHFCDYIICMLFGIAANVVEDVIKRR
jgi:hypothetical protein